MLEPLCALAAAANPVRRATMAPFVERAPATDGDRYHRETVAFHVAIYELAANPVLRLLTEAITHTVTSHVLATTDPVELHDAIVAEHVDIARAVSEGDGRTAQRLTAEHFGAQHDYYRRVMPARLEQLIEWR